MRIAHVDSPDLTDAACREETGRTPRPWYDELDRLGRIARGRRALANFVLEHGHQDAWWSTAVAVEHERAPGQREKRGQPTGDSLCATKTISAPLPEVFAASADGNKLDAWLGPRAKIRFEAGATLENADGDRRARERRT